MSNTTEYSGGNVEEAGDRGGANRFDDSCPPGHLLTGIKLKANNYIDGIQQFYCKKPKDINTKEDVTVDTDDIGGRGGSEHIFKCGPGSVLSDISTRWGDWIDSQEYMCTDFKSGNISKVSEKRYGGGGGEKTATLSCKDDNHYIAGMSGEGGAYVDFIKLRCDDFSQAKDALYTTEGKIKCCTGEYDDANCELSKGTSKCDAFMADTCALSKYKNDPACSCINSNVIKELREKDSSFPLCPHIYDPKCQNDGYKPTGLPTAECSYLNCTIDIAKSVIKNGADVISVCSSNKSGGVDANFAEQVSQAIRDGKNASAATTSNWTYGLIIGIVIFIIIILGVGAYFLFYRNNDTDIDMPRMEPPNSDY
jgi:hypothetical protein